MERVTGDNLVQSGMTEQPHSQRKLYHLPQIIPSYSYQQPVELESQRQDARVKSNVARTKTRSSNTLRQSSTSKPTSSTGTFESHGRYLPLPFLMQDGPEKDDRFHSSGPPGKRKGAARYVEDTEYIRGHSSCFPARGFLNLCSLILILVCVLGLFVGWPLTDVLRKKVFAPAYKGDYGTSYYNETFVSRGLIDKDTPDDVKIIKGVNGDTLRLVFSDEFNTEGRTFWAGDDPYWEAVDLHYWSTGDLEWYDPEQVTTKDGSLVIEVKKKDSDENHDLKYESGMLQSWNKFCFSSGAYIQASVQLPGFQPDADTEYVTFWAAIWALGNLGRAGYGATTHGTWPYSYDACDVGTVKNQSIEGVPQNTPAFSYQPGQKLSACTCHSEDHPGPKRTDGSYVGRASPEMDLFESSNKFVTQSAQFAPFNLDHKFRGGISGAYSVDEDAGFTTKLNSWFGNSFQQSTSAVSTVPENGYEQAKNPRFVTYGLEYSASTEDGFIAWTMEDKECWRINKEGLGPDSDTRISARQISDEPMSININVAISTTFGAFSESYMEEMLPAKMKVDWIRVYQKEDGENLGCDPVWAPTTKYISDHLEAYANPNRTTWEQAGYSFPKNRLVDQC